MKGSTNAGGSSTIQPEQIDGYNSTTGVAVRGTELSTEEKSPQNNGEIVWVYE